MDRLPSVNSYMKNLGKSIKYVAINEIRDTIPIVFETKESNEEAISSIRSRFRNKNKLKTISNIAKDSEFYKSGNELYKNLKSSIKTGSFYSQKRQDKADNDFMKSFMGGDLDFEDDFKMDADEGDLNDESEESLNQNADALNELNDDLNSGFEASATAISNTTVESARYVGETVKASAAMAYAQNNEQTYLMRTGFKSLDDGLKKLVSFNTDILQKHIQNSTTFFDNTSKLLNEQNAMMKEMLEMQRNVYKANQATENKTSFNKYADIVSSSGVVNISEYFKNVKSNFAEWSEPIMMLLNMMKANPLEMVIQGGLSFLGSDSMKRAGSDLNKTLSGVFGKYLSFIEKQAKKNGGIWDTLNDIFGVRNRNKIDIDTGLYEKGPMQFNGIANKAITEVIPGYLARIESALTGGEERYFNFNNGRWTNTRKIRNEYNKKLNSSAENTGLSDLFAEIGSSLNRVNYDNYGGVKISSKDKNDLLNSVMSTIVKNNGDIDDSFIVRSKKGHNYSDMESFYKIFGFKESELTKSQKAMLNIIATALANTSTSTRASLNNTVRQAKGSTAQFKQSIEDDQYNISRVLVNGALSGSRFVEDAVPYGEGSMDTIDSYKEPEPASATTSSSKKNKKGKNKKYANNSVNKVMTATSTMPINFAKQIFYSVSTTDEFIELHNSADVPVVKKMIGYISGLKNITELNERSDAIDEFETMVKRLESSDFVECKQYEKFIEYVQNKNIASAGKSGLFTDLPPVAKNFFTFIYSLVSKDNITTSEGLAKSVDDAHTYKREFSYDKYEGKGLFDKLDKAKGIDKLGVLMGYTKKLTSMPFDVLGAVIAKTDRVIYDMFFGNDQREDSSGKKITGFFHLMTSKIGDAVDSLYKEVKNRIWGKEQWNQYKDIVYNDFSSIIKKGKSFFSNDDDNEESTDNDSAESTEETNKSVAKNNTKNRKRKSKLKRKRAKRKKIRGAAFGLGMVPETDVYTLHKGEAVIPAYMNPEYTGSDIDPEKHAKDEAAVAKKYGLSVKGYAKGTVKDESKEEKKEKESMLAWLKRTYPAALGEGTVGGILGTIVAGPLGLVGGAALGAANYVLKNSTTANKFLFGDTDKKSLFTRTKSGLKKILPKSITNFFEEQDKKVRDIGKMSIAGGTLGLIGGAIGGPFGLMGGLMLGAATGVLKNYEGAQKLVFGNHDVKGKLDSISSKKYLKSVGLGALAGGLLGGPFGMLGGAMLGVAGQFASESDTFKNFMFGELDEKTGKRKYKEGFLGKIGEKIISPLGTLKDDIIHYMDANVFQPISRAFVPLTRYTQLGMRGLFKKIQKGLDAIVNPSMKLRWYQNLPTIMKGPAGRYIGHGLAGAAGGFMYGGPMGAILGGVLGGASAIKFKDKTIASWLGKGAAWLGTKPGKILDFGTRRLNKKLIAKGNMDSISMSAKDRVDFMEKNDYAYDDERYKENDITLRDSSISQLKAMKATIEIAKDLSDKSGKNKAQIEGKIKEVVKSIPNLDHSSMQKILKLIRKAIKSDKPEDVPNAINSITNILSERGLDDTQIKQYMKPIRLGVSGLSSVKMEKDSLKNDLANRTKMLKDTYDFNIVNGDIDKALEQVDSEIQIRDKKGETVEKESLDKGDAAIVQSTNKVNKSIELSNLYLKAIKEQIADGKVHDDTSKELKDFLGNTPNIVSQSNSDNKPEDETWQFSQKTGTMVKMAKTSDGGYKPDITDKDTKEAIEKADAERTAILTLGEYAKSKLKDTKKSIKNRASKFANSAVFGGIKDIFKSLFGMPFGIVGDILGMIPGASLLKGKLGRFAGDKLSKWSTKLSTKAEKWGKAGSVLGKIGGKVGKFGGFLLKNMADAATAAADAEESTPEFQTELEAFNYMARKISGVEAAIVAKAESVDQGINNFLPDTLTSPGTIKRTIDPKTGKPIAQRNGQGFFGGLWNKTKSGASKAWNGLKTGMKAVSSKAMAAVGPVLGWVQNGLKKVFDFAAKFLPSNIGNKISSFGSTILKKVSNPKVAVKVAEKAAKKGIQLGLGPIGWAFIAGSIAVSFYQGYNNAETIWNNGSEDKNEDLSMGDKAICGICSVVSNELLFGIISPSEVLDIAKSIFGKIKGVTDTIKDKASGIMNTISGYKDKLLNAGKEMWNKVKTSLGKTWDNIKDSVGNAIQGIKDTFDKFKKIGISTLAELLKHPIDWITNKAKSLFGLGSGDTKPTTPSVTTYTDTRKKKVISANTSDKVDLNADPDHGIGTGLATAVEQPKTPGLNVDPDKGIGTQDGETVEDKLNKYRKEQQESNSNPSWKDRFNGVYVKGVGMIPTGGPLSGDSLRRYRLSSIGGGDMTPEGIWNLLTTKYHYSNQAAAAIMGSMQQESSFNPNASQGGGGIEASIAQGEGTNGFGLCQWTGSRTQALVNFCNSNNLDPTTVEGQVAFMNYEMGQRGSNAAFNSADSVDAACQVMKDYEGYGEIGNREVYAQQIFQNQGKGLTSAGSASGGSSSGNKSNADNSVFGKIDQLFNKAFAPFNSIFGNLFGDSDSSSSNGSSSSSGGGAGSAASDMSGTIDSGSTADKLLSSLKAEANGDATVSAPYGEQNHMGHTHGGIDIAAPAGTPIKSPISGTVIDNREGGGYGYYVQIKDKNNMDHLFPHMESPSPLEQGSQVSEGDVVGYVGSTGNSTGPHVHYEIDDDAVNQGAEVSKPHINPGKYMGGPLSGDSTLKFRKKVNDLANAGNRAAIKALKKGYGSDNIGVGGPTDSDSLVNTNIPNNNSNTVVKDYSDQLNTIISLLGVIASAVQTQVATAGANTTANLQGQVNNTMGTTTPNTSILNIMKSMLNIASH